MILFPPVKEKQLLQMEDNRNCNVLIDERKVLTLQPIQSDIKENGI